MQGQDLHGYKFKHCRTFGHSWSELKASSIKRTSIGTAFEQSCSHCPTVVVTTMSRATGEVLDRRYDYPDGYKDEGSHIRADFRAALVRELTARRAGAR